MRREGMAETVAVCALHNSRGIDGSFQRALQNSFGDVMTLLLSHSRVDRNARRRKNVLPRPFARSIGKFAAQSEGQMHTAEAVFQILLVLRFDPQKMSPQWFGQV